MENKICRIAVFYDGTYFNKVSNYYLYNHDRKARISIRGLHDFVLSEVAAKENADVRRCQIVDASYFRGRLTAQQAFDQDKLYSERAFEDVLMRADVTMFQQHVSVRADGSFEEKTIDVWLALEAYEMASLKKYDVCVLVTGDGDFVPLVRKLNTIGSRVMLLGWDFSYEKDGRTIRTQVSTNLIDRVNYPVMMNTEIDARERRTDPLISGLFMPRSAEVQPTASCTTSVKEATPPAKSDDEDRKGSVVSLLLEKGFGFIKPAGGGENVFFHAKDLVHVVFGDLKVGDKLIFVLGKSDRGAVALNVRVDASV